MTLKNDIENNIENDIKNDIKNDIEKSPPKMGFKKVYFARFKPLQALICLAFSQ